MFPDHNLIHVLHALDMVGCCGNLFLFFFPLSIGGDRGFYTYAPPYDLGVGIDYFPSNDFLILKRDILLILKLVIIL